MNVLMHELFATGTGLLTVFTIAFVIAMGGWLYKYARRKMAEDLRASQGKRTAP